MIIIDSMVNEIYVCQVGEKIKKSSFSKFTSVNRTKTTSGFELMIFGLQARYINH